MRILHIMASKGLGGAETYATDVMLSLHAEGEDQIAVVSDKAPRFAELQKAGLRLAPKVLACPIRPIQRFMLARLIAREKPDIIHCWMRRAASLMPAGFDGPVIGWFGGYYDPRHFTRCTSFVGVTEDIVAHMVKLGVPSEKAHFVPTFPDVPDDPPVDRATLGVGRGQRAVLALSRLHPKKGLDVLIRAVQTMPDVVLWLAGQGPLRAELEALVQTLGLQERVRFLGWRTDRGALLRAADVCCLPSRYEPFGTVILEAWAAKTPFVACRSAGPAAHVADGENGLLVPIDDVDSLRTALRRALDDHALRAKLIATGYAAYASTYTREAVTARMLALYEELLAERGSQK